MKILDLGLIDFSDAFAVQERLVEEVAAGSSPEALLLLEHTPVYTIGRGGSGANVLDPSVRAVEINRGGDVTFHGPGQLVGYPIVSLARRGRDLHRYLRFLEEVLIASVAGFGVEAWRTAGRTGIWTIEGKLASIGVGVRRWVSMHGFALNVANELAPFSRINPCGIVDCPVTLLSALLGRRITIEEAKAAVSERFEGMLDEWLPETAQSDSLGEDLRPQGAHGYAAR